MFQKTDFWLGLAVGAVAGIFGYRFMQELQRQKEELEDLIAAQEAKK